MDWAKLAEAAAPAAIAAVALIVAAAVGFLGGILGGRLNFRAEVMKLRHSIAERRVKEFDEAASALRGLILRSLTVDSKVAEQFWEHYLPAVQQLGLATDLALMPEHSKLLEPLDPGGLLLKTCQRLHETLHLSSDKLRSGGVGDYARSTVMLSVILRALMRAVDVSTEARIEGRSSRKHTAAIKAIGQDLKKIEEVTGSLSLARLS